MSDTYRADIDGLRAVSIGLVVAYHAGVDTVAGGYVGVDVFFVISGFLITRLLLGELERTGTISLRGFIARRARRLLPLAGVVLSATALAVGVLSAPVDRGRLFDDITSAAVFVANWRFAASATDYSDISVAESPVNHWWSLAVEEQFYVIWPLVILAVVAILRRWRRISVPTGLTIAVATIVAVSLAASIRLTENLGPAAYYVTPLRVWELGLGALLATLLASRPRRELVLSRWVRELLSAGGLVAILVCAGLYDASTPFPGSAAIIPVLATVAVLIAGHSGPTVTGSILSRRAFVRVGQWSYAWYLWHWPAIAVAILLAERYGWAWSSGYVTAGAVIGSLILAAGSYCVIERPIRHAAVLSRRYSPSIAVGAAAVVAPLAVTGIMAATIDHGDDEFVLASGAIAMSPSAAAEDVVDLPGSEDCNATIVESSPGADCIFGDPDGTVEIVVIGDSHAQHWLPALDAIGRRRSWVVHAHTKSACAAIDIPIMNRRLERRYEECATWHDELGPILTSLDVDLVVLVNTHGYARLLIDDDDDEVTDPMDIATRWSAAAEATFTRLLDSTTTVVRLGDTPWSPEDVPGCLSRHPTRPENCSFTRDEHSHRDRMLLDAERAAVARLGLEDRVRFLDPTPIVCPDSLCQSVRGDGTVVYRDSHHLTQTFSRRAADDLAVLLSPVVQARRVG